MYVRDPTIAGLPGRDTATTRQSCAPAAVEPAGMATRRTLGAAGASFADDVLDSFKKAGTPEGEAKEADRKAGLDITTVQEIEDGYSKSGMTPYEVANAKSKFMWVNGR